MVPYRYLPNRHWLAANVFIAPELKEMTSVRKKCTALLSMHALELRDILSENVSFAFLRWLRMWRWSICCTFALIAYEKNYIRPKMSDTGELHIAGGRHLLLLRHQSSKAFVKNDTHMRPKSAS